MADPFIQPRTVRELSDCILDTQYDCILPVGGKTKSALTNSPIDQRRRAMVSSTALQGVLDYQPSDFTITVRAGTTVREVQDVLEGKGQFLPFDPPMVDRGSTIGGMVATGWNGSCRMKWGGIRDFILAIEFVDGTGKVVRGGAAVVKNSAGYDLPKLFVGSCGRLGYLTAVSLKVFPKPKSCFTVAFSAPTAAAVVEAMTKMSRTCTDVIAMDWVDKLLWVRWHGSEHRGQQIRDALVTMLSLRSVAFLSGEEDTAWWRNRSHPEMPHQDASLIKVTCTRNAIAVLEDYCNRSGIDRVYCHAGNSCLLTMRGRERDDELDATFHQLGCQGIVLMSQAPCREFGIAPSVRDFRTRIARGLDPTSRFS